MGKRRRRVSPSPRRGRRGRNQHVEDVHVHRKPSRRTRSKDRHSRRHSRSRSRSPRSRLGSRRERRDQKTKSQRSPSSSSSCWTGSSRVDSPDIAISQQGDVDMRPHQLGYWSMYIKPELPGQPADGLGGEESTPAGPWVEHHRDDQEQACHDPPGGFKVEESMAWVEHHDQERLHMTEEPPLSHDVLDSEESKPGPWIEVHKDHHDHHKLEHIHMTQEPPYPHPHDGLDSDGPGPVPWYPGREHHERVYEAPPYDHPSGGYEREESMPGPWQEVYEESMPPGPWLEHHELLERHREAREPRFYQAHDGSEGEQSMPGPWRDLHAVHGHHRGTRVPPHHGQVHDEHALRYPERHHDYHPGGGLEGPWHEPHDDRGYHPGLVHCEHALDVGHGRLRRRPPPDHPRRDMRDHIHGYGLPHEHGLQHRLDDEQGHSRAYNPPHERGGPPTEHPAPAERRRPHPEHPAFHPSRGHGVATECERLVSACPEPLMRDLFTPPPDSVLRGCAPCSDTPPWRGYNLPHQHPRLVRPRHSQVFVDHNGNSPPMFYPKKRQRTAPGPAPPPLPPPQWPHEQDFTQDVDLDPVYQDHHLVDGLMFGHPAEPDLRTTLMRREDLRHSLESRKGNDLRKTLDRKRTQGIYPLQQCSVQPPVSRLPHVHHSEDLRSELNKKREAHSPGQGVAAQNILNFDWKPIQYDHGPSFNCSDPVHDPDLHNVAAALKDCLDYEAMLDFEAKGKVSNVSEPVTLLSVPINYDFFPNRKRAADFFPECQDCCEYSVCDSSLLYSNFDFEKSAHLEKVVEAFLASLRCSPVPEKKEEVEAPIKIEKESLKTRLRPRPKPPQHYVAILKRVKKVKKVLKNSDRVKSKAEEKANVTIKQEFSDSEDDEPLVFRLQKRSLKSKTTPKSEPVSDKG